MKSKKLVVFFGIIGVLLFGVAYAETFSPVNCLYVDADTNGRVITKGSPIDIAMLTTAVQFCPDQLKADAGGSCDVLRNKYQDFVIINPGEATFQLNMRSISDKGQVAFNLKNGRLWLLITNPNVVVGKNLALEMSYPNPGSEDGKGGTHFVYTGHGYVPKYPVSGGGEACVGGSLILNLAVPEKVPCKVTLRGEATRTKELKRIITAYWGVEVEIKAVTKGHDVVVTGAGGTRMVPVSDKLLTKLEKLSGDGNAGDSLNSLCPKQAKSLREAIGDCK